MMSSNPHVPFWYIIFILHFSQFYIYFRWSLQMCKVRISLNFAYKITALICKREGKSQYIL
jgi:hypothetical protein